MPTLVTERGIVHYETYGRGRPVILLHGWLGSWALWRDTIEELGKEYRTYALDFFGFGDSLDRSSAEFSVENYVELVYQFMDRLGIVKAPLIGHSMGGTVALGVASRYPDRVVKVVVIGAPVNGSSLNPFLKLSGYRIIAKLVHIMPFIKDAFILIITRRGKMGGSIHRMVKADASKVEVDSFFQSIGTLRDTNLTDDLPSLKIPILGIYGKRDVIVNPSQSKLLLKVAPTAQEAWFENCGHFVMIDEPEDFLTIVTEFLQNS